jgi:23S rRNA (cytosine1962-C5)-methyltransferase
LKTRTFSESWDQYELIDAGGGKKLERWGNVITIRPEVQAYFKSELPFAEWNKMANWEFIPSAGQSGKWKCLKKGSPSEWKISYKRMQFQLQITQFKHLGLFPEQRTNWDYIDENLNTDAKFLNLFAYTGAASCIARNRGAETFHVDSVKQLITWAKTNMELSRLLNIKWVHEDALKFAERENKREHRYDGIIMDPPAWGLGAKGEKWKLEDKIDNLIAVSRDLMADNAFLIVNTYSPTFTIEMLAELVELYCEGLQTDLSELWMKTTTGKELYFGNLLRVKK